MENPKIPTILTRRQDLHQQIKSLAKVHLQIAQTTGTNQDSDDYLNSQLDITDCSGMSNPVFIVGLVNSDCDSATSQGSSPSIPKEDSSDTSGPYSKIVIRFFESSAANFEVEHKVFEIASDKGLAPGVIETDYKTYRVEKYFNGRPFSYSELSQIPILEQTMPLICDFNYDPELVRMLPKWPFKESEMKSMEFITSKEEGWYWRAKNEIYPLVKQLKEQFSADKLQPWQETFDIFDEIERTLFLNEKGFEEEYRNLLPQITDNNVAEVVVFSHNDTQENNFLYRSHKDSAPETKIIDFEYSQPNYRGADIASYANECTINYKVSQRPFFEYDESKYINLFENPQFKGSQDTFFGTMCKKFLERYYLKFRDNSDGLSLQQYLDHETPLMEQQVRRQILQQHIFWVVWCLVMLKPCLADGDKLWDTEKKVMEGLDHLSEFYIPYAKLRMDLYFKQREYILPAEAHILQPVHPFQ